MKQGVINHSLLNTIVRHFVFGGTRNSKSIRFVLIVQHDPELQPLTKSVITSLNAYMLFYTC